MNQKIHKLKRIDVDTLRPKKLKPFDPDKFMRMAKELKEAVEAEEKKYGPLQDTHAPCW